jgi:hypothetical protein
MMLLRGIDRSDSEWGMGKRKAINPMQYLFICSICVWPVVFDLLKIEGLNNTKLLVRFLVKNGRMVQNKIKHMKHMTEVLNLLQ